MHVVTKPTWRPSPPLAARSGCTICRGTGWELLAYSGAARARPCSCRALRQLMALRDRARIPHQYEHCSLENYRPGTPMQVRAHAEARRWALNYPGSGRDLFFAGLPGVGKTHLAVGIVRHLVGRFHEDVLFLDLPAFSAALRASSRFGGTTHSCQDRTRACHVSVLVLDDFGIEYPEKMTVDAIEEILRTRRSEGKQTIYTGGPIRPQELLRGAASPSSRSQSLFAALPPGTLYDSLSNLRILFVDGDDFRPRASSGALPF